MSEFKKMSRRIFAIAVVIVAGFVYVGYTLYQLQVTRHEELLEKARKRYVRGGKIGMSRGKIFDHDGNEIVTNLNVVTLAFDCNEIQNADERRAVARFLERELPSELNITEDSIMQSINAGDKWRVNAETGQREQYHNKYVVLVKNIDLAKIPDLEAVAKNSRIKGMKGLIFENRSIRSYPKKELFSNIVGYMQDNKPVTGIEKSLNCDLVQEDGYKSVERSRTGQKISFGDTENVLEGRNGANIYLTARETIQAIMEEELDRMYKECTPKAIYAVMVDPYTGDILAISQRPTYNPGDRTTMVDGNYNIRIASDMFEPGSVIKPFVVAMGLDGGYITMDTKIDTGFGPWRYAGHALHDTHYIGTVDPLRIIQNSSNIGTAMIALRMGDQELYRTLKTFRFGEKSGLAFSNESRGYLKPLEKWQKISATRMCMGHELTVTPLQLVRAYCMLANGGYDINLRLIEAIETDENGKRPYKQTSLSNESVFKKPDTHKNIVKMLKTVPRPGGTAELAAVPGYYVAGKTGTANKVVNGQYSKDFYFATFCGFVPADNPRFVLLVTCDEPHGKAKYGGSVSGPTFSRIAARTLKYFGVAPEVPLDQWEKEWKQAVQDKWKEFIARDKERAARQAAGKSLFAPSMDAPKQPARKQLKKKK